MSEIYIPPTRSPLNDIVYGSVAGVVSKSIEHPFDLVKVRLQSQPLDRPFKFTGPLDCFIQTVKGEGVKALWRGVSMPIAGAMAENATLFLVCNQMQGLLRRLDPPPPISLSTSTPIGRPPIAFGHLAISAAVAGSCASFVLTPVELVKCKMQVQNIIPSATTTATTTTAAIKSPGPITITQQILKRDGFKGLWLGQTGTFIRETGGSAAWFVAFELGVSYFLSRRESRGERPPPANGGAREMNSGGEVLGEIKRERDYLIKADLAAWELMLSGAIAGVTYNVMLFPADCIKSAVQTEDELRRGGGLTGKRTSFLATGKEILKARGIRGLYQGCGLTALRAAPSSALIFYIYSRMESIFG